MDDWLCKRFAVRAGCIRGAAIANEKCASDVIDAIYDAEFRAAV
jgi:hypothetical protein